jgi:hypothetical protein
MTTRWAWTSEGFAMVFEHNLRLSFEVSLTFLLFFCRDVEEIGNGHCIRSGKICAFLLKSAPYTPS